VTYVLDTNAVSALMRSHPRVVARLSGVARAYVAVPQPVLAEIVYGIERLPVSRRREVLQQRFELLRSELPRAAWTDEVSDAFGRIKARLEKLGRRIEYLDAAVAAHALAHGAILVTANVRRMGRMTNLFIEDWSERSE
jgi:tRNA(fMet)-specific endonuclease VapC